MMNILTKPGEYQKNKNMLKHTLLLLLIGFLALSNPAHAARKFALLIGNSAYSGADALRNPGRDVDLLAATFKKAGYEVLVNKNVNTRSLQDTLKTFRTRAANSDIAVFYYAGHGLAFNGHNYMVPVDKAVTDVRSHELIAQGVSFENIEERLLGASVKNILFFVDACRTPPTRGASLNGFVAPKAKSGSLYLFSTQPGALARDGTDNHSPFAFALAKHIANDSLSLKQIVQSTKADVDLATGGTQVPWVADGLAGDLNLHTAQSFIPSVTKNASKASMGNNSADAAAAQSYWAKYLYDLESEIEIVVNSTGAEELKTLQERAKNGDSMALTALGYLYLRPNPTAPGPDQVFKKDNNTAVGVVNRNPKVALGYLQQASKKGSILADTVIGEIYFDGEGVKTDYQKARQYFEKGTAVGHLRARMGMMALRTRLGEPVDPMEILSLTAEYSKLMAARYSRPGNSPYK